MKSSTVTLVFNDKDIRELIYGLLPFEVSKHQLDALVTEFYDTHELKDYKGALTYALESMIYDMDLEGVLDRISGKPEEDYYDRAI